MTRQVTLSQPIARGDKQITTVSLREPKAGELRGLNNFDVLQASVTAHRTLVPRISELSVAEFDQLTPADMLAIQQEVIAFFMPGGLGV
ncbi:MAG: phage tail assembly protein [Shewanella sp.]|nr:phage tail assembly protein [Shewanella sp.]